MNLFALAATQNKGGQAMSKISSGILGAIAVSLSFGAAQFALGSDLHRLQQPATPAAEATVNREAKADRADAPATGLKTQTISVRVDGLADTSILVRVPLVRKEASSSTKAAPAVSSKPMSRTVACEPVVSVLTEVAKQLQPGRCVT